MFCNIYQLLPVLSTKASLRLGSLKPFVTTRLIVMTIHSGFYFVFSKQTATLPTTENFRHTILCQIRQSECIFLHEKQSPTNAHNRKR